MLNSMMCRITKYQDEQSFKINWRNGRNTKKNKNENEKDWKRMKEEKRKLKLWSDCVCVSKLTSLNPIQTTQANNSEKFKNPLKVLINCKEFDRLLFYQIQDVLVCAIRFIFVSFRAMLYVAVQPYGEEVYIIMGLK